MGEMNKDKDENEIKNKKRRKKNNQNRGEIGEIQTKGIKYT